MRIVSKLIDRRWLYRAPDVIRSILTERATKNTKTGQPLIYFSTDAHSLRRYVDDTWDACWKMANGLRIWCVDRCNGAVIHLGGEYTWEDCKGVSDIVKALIHSGILPENGDYGDGVVAQLIVTTDGASWIEDHILPLLPWATKILDPYHVLERLAKYARNRFGKGSKKAKQFYNELVDILLDLPPHRRKKKGKKRKGHVKRARGRSKSLERTASCAEQKLGPHRLPRAELLYDYIADEPGPISDSESHAKLLKFIEHNMYRMDYLLYRNRGYQIGSGAMESLHRIASQARLKIPGGTWLPETAQSIFNLRMMGLVDKWDDFWRQDGFTKKLTEAFVKDKTTSETEKLCA